MSSERDRLLRRCETADEQALFELINAAADAYRGVIPADCWHEPYMPLSELRNEIANGVAFWGLLEEDVLIGAAGIQDKGDAALIRHVYVATAAQRSGCGTVLLRQLESLHPVKPLLVGTWADATWAIAFYVKAGYTLLPTARKNQLLRTYWTIPPRQVDTSVVLAKRLP